MLINLIYILEMFDDAVNIWISFQISWCSLLNQLSKSFFIDLSLFSFVRSILKSLFPLHICHGTLVASLSSVVRHLDMLTIPVLGFTLTSGMILLILLVTWCGTHTTSSPRSSTNWKVIPGGKKQKVQLKRWFALGKLSNRNSCLGRVWQSAE